jgi:NADH:ubiquinone oxidoreductase subunit E
MKIEAAQKISMETASRELAEIYEKYRHVHGSAIPILQEIQGLYGYLPEEAVNWIADRLDIPRSTFFGLATFYSQFYFKPRGKNIVTVCCGTACHVKGSEKILTRLQRELGLLDGQDTTDDMNFTVEKVNCVGACSIAPVVIMNKQVHGKATAEKMIRKTRVITRKQGAEDEDA